LLRDVEVPLKHININYAKKPDYELNYHFENGIVKIQTGFTLTASEAAAVKIFKLSTDDIEEESESARDNEDIELNYADDILKAVNEAAKIKKTSLSSYRSCCSYF
jgi:hypothetical protein